MEFKQLKIKNLGSVESVVINLASLDDVPAFVVGDGTVDGCEMLYDAICLACFGTTRSLKESVNQHVVTGTGGYTIADLHKLVRNGARDASVELSMVGKDGEPAVATWICSFEKNETLGKWMNTMQVQGESLLTGAKALDRAERLLGMDYDRFSRLMLLPLGGMMQWISADEPERALILERLTRSDHYSSVGNMVSTMYREKRDDYERQQMRLDAYHLMIDEDRRVLMQEVDLCQKQIQQLDARWAATNEKCEWLEHQIMLNSEADACRSDLKALKEIREAPHYVREEKFLNDWRCSVDARLAWDEMNAVMTAQESLENLKGDYGRKYDWLMAGYNYLMQSIQRQNDAMEMLKKKQQQESQYAMVYKNISVLPHLSMRLSASNKQLEGLSLHKAQLDESNPKLMSLLDESRKKMSKMEDELHCNQHDLQLLRSEYSALSPASQADLQQRLVDELMGRKEAIEALGLLDDAITQYENAVLAREELEQTMSKCELECYEAGIRAQEARRVYEETKRVYANTCHGVGDEARVLRMKVHSGDSCPVCGNRVNAVANEDELKKNFAPFELDMSEKEQQWLAIEQEYGSLRKAVERYRQNDVQKLRKVCDKTEDKMHRRFGRAVELCRMAGVPLNEPQHTFVQHAMAVLDEQCRDLKSQKKEVLDCQNYLSKLQQRVSDAEGELAATIERFGEAKVDLMRCTVFAEQSARELQMVEGEMKIVDEEIERCRKRIDDMFGNDYWYSDWSHDADAFVEKWKARASKNEEDVAQMAKGEESMRVMLLLKNQVDQERAVIEKSMPEWTGRMRMTPSCVEDLVAEWTDFTLKIERMVSDRANTERRRLVLQERLQLFVSQFPKVRLEELVLSTQQNFEAIASQHKDCDERWLQLQGAMDALDQRLLDHATHRPESMHGDDTVECLRRECVDLKDKQADLQAQCGQKRGMLQIDGSNRVASESDRLRLELCKNEYDKWGVLYNLVGLNNGEAFRNIAQSYLLGGLVNKANLYMQCCGMRGSMELKPGTLDLRYAVGGKIVPVNHLPESQQRLVALALSMAIATNENNRELPDVQFVDGGLVDVKAEDILSVNNVLDRVYKTTHRSLGLMGCPPEMVCGVVARLAYSRR